MKVSPKKIGQVRAEVHGERYVGIYISENYNSPPTQLGKYWRYKPPLTSQYIAKPGDSGDLHDRP